MFSRVLPALCRRRLLSRCVLFVIIVALAWWLIRNQTSHSPQKRSSAPVAVGVATVQQQDVPITLNALGTVNALNTVTVRSRVDGQLDTIDFVEGQQVKVGQRLAQLDPRPYQAALMQAQGQWMRDQALLKNAELDLQRYQTLLTQNSIAKQQVDTQAALVRQYQGTVKMDQGGVDNAQLQLQYSTITSPIHGQVGLRQIDVGNRVSTNDANGIAIITQIQPINVVFAVPETQLSPVLAAARQNRALRVAAWDRDHQHKIADGYLLAIDNQLNTSTGTINLKARFRNEKQQLFPNQFVNVELHLGTQRGASTIPTPAVQLSNDGPYVYTVDPTNTVQMRRVKTGTVLGETTVIMHGLQPGWTVVIDGLDKLRAGIQVKPIHRATHLASIAKHDQTPSKNASSLRHHKVQ